MKQPDPKLQRQFIRLTLFLAAGAIPFLGLIKLAEVAQTRSPADLEIADRCVDWAHKPREARMLDGPGIAARCERYFRVRSDKNEDEDDRRWEARAGHQARH